MKSAGFQGLNLNCFNFLSLLSCALIPLASLGPYDDDDDDDVITQQDEREIKI
jgi:hypothetical protein